MQSVRCTFITSVIAMSKRKTNIPFWAEREGGTKTEGTRERPPKHYKRMCISWTAQLIVSAVKCKFKLSSKRLNLALRTSRFSTDFGACEFVSEQLCFERFFLRLLFFSSQLIATNSWARRAFVFVDIHKLFDSLEKQGFVLSGTQHNKTEGHQFPHFLTEATHQNGALKIPGMPIDLDHKELWAFTRGGEGLGSERRKDMIRRERGEGCEGRLVSSARY